MARSKQAYYMARIKHSLRRKQNNHVLDTDILGESETSILSVYRSEQNRNIRWREQTTQRYTLQETRHILWREPQL